MKKLLVLILIGFLAACESSALMQEEEVVVEPVVVAPEPVEVEVTTYLVRYVIGYSGLIEEETKEANTVVRLMLPVREGYRFDGWFLDEAFTRPTDRFVTIQSDLDVYAKWIEIIKEPQEIVFEDIRNHFSFDYKETHPIDYYVSPSQSQEKADAIFEGMLIAAGLLATYLDGLDPISLTIVHPNDKEWYEEHEATLDLFDYGDPWFERTSMDGGAAVMESYSGRPHMIYNIPDKQIPDLVNMDYLVHETFHVFQLGRLSGDRFNRDRNLGCMYTEGGATLIGNVLAYVNSRSAFNHFDNARNGRIEKMQRYYATESDVANAIYDQLVNGQNDRCNVQEPGFGYNLGALVAEKMVLDFGIEAFMAMHYDFNRYRIDEVFEDRFDTNYFEWIEDEAVPYVTELIT
jgi:uncharacterized repeat protein (TIGR02543 family)